MYGLEGLLAGRTLVGRYRIESVLGRGGMGAVYRAVDERLGRPVAIKVISVAAVDADAHARLRARFHREARAAAGLHHPHVVAVYDFGTDPELQLDFLVMELLRGEDLARRLERTGPPPQALAVSLLVQAARGLAAGHRAGLIHRDVKPGNLFLESGDRAGDVHVKVLDFGIAEIAGGDDQTLTHLTVAGSSPFSPAYASPEQLRGNARLSPATDVFSLGAVGFQLLTGRRAFTASDPLRAVVELSTSVAALRDDGSIPVSLRSALRRALATDPSGRFPDAAAFADALAPEGSGRPAATIPPDATRWVARPSEPRGPAEHTRHLRTPADAPRPAPAPPVMDRREGWRRPVRPEQPQPPAVARERLPARQWLQRTAAVVWSVAVTAVSVMLFAGSWVAAVHGLRHGEMDTLIGGLAASSILTPYAVHRVFGSRGSVRLGIFGSIVASVGAMYLIGTDAAAEVLVPTMLGFQLAISLVVYRLTRRAARRGTAEPERTPIGV